MTIINRINIKKELEEAGLESTEQANGLSFNNINVEPDKIRAIMINEVVPMNPLDDFYGGPNAAYLTTTIPLFQTAGIDAATIWEILLLEEIE